MLHCTHILNTRRVQISWKERKMTLNGRHQRCERICAWLMKLTNSFGINTRNATELWHHPLMSSDTRWVCLVRKVNTLHCCYRMDGGKQRRIWQQQRHFLRNKFRIHMDTFVMILLGFHTSFLVRICLLFELVSYFIQKIFFVGYQRGINSWTWRTSFIPLVNDKFSGDTGARFAKGAGEEEEDVDTVCFLTKLLNIGNLKVWHYLINSSTRSIMDSMED